MITRARVTEPFNTYYEGVPLSFAAGDVIEGPIADFLYEGGSAVEPVKDGDEQHGPDGGESKVPDGSAKDVLDWVGDDPERAQAALDAEAAKDKPRSTLQADLKKIADV